MKNLVLVFGLLLVGVVANAQRTEAPSAADNAGRSTASSSRSVIPTPASVLKSTVQRTVKGGTIGKEQPRDPNYWARQAQQRANRAKADRASKSVGRSTLPKLSKPVSKPVIRPGCNRC